VTPGAHRLWSGTVRTRAASLVAVLLTVSACTGGSGSPAGAPPATSSTASSSTASSTAPSSASARDLLPGPGPCPPTPATIAGPTWFDAHVMRSDVREGRPGVELTLAFRVVRAGPCTPVPGAVVDLWQADAGGVYSGFAGARPGDGGPPDGRDEYGRPQARATDPGRALRGTQPASADGVVQFTTIYPGWYPTRTPHLHVEVHVGGATVLTTQVFFDDAVSDRVFAAHPEYRQHGTRDTRNATDPFWSRPAHLHLAPDGPRWLGALVLAVS
jgi:protocatechuate 3,4-dioxygenase beta subunit